MADYEQTRSIRADPDAAFAFLSDAKNMPSYVSTMVGARPVSAERMEVAADVEGRHEQGAALVHANAEQRRLEWSGESGRGYHGWMHVAPVDAGGSTVTIHLVTAGDEDAHEIEQALSETLANIERRLSTGS